MEYEQLNKGEKFYIRPEKNKGIKKNIKVKYKIAF